MIEFVLAFVLFALSIGALALGVLTGRGPVTASCGGDPMLRICPLCKGKDHNR